MQTFSARSCLFVLFTSVFVLALPLGAAEDPEAAARALLDDFFVAFNQQDNQALQKIANYPHAFLLANGRMIIAEEPSQLVMNFARMRESEGWHRSGLDSAEATRVSDDKVHFEIVFSRYHEDGTRYRQVPALWIATRVDGHWGLQFRSLMPPTSSE